MSFYSFIGACGEAFSVPHLSIVDQKGGGDVARGVSREGVSGGACQEGRVKEGRVKSFAGRLLVAYGAFGALAFLTISPKRATVASTFLHCAREPRLCNVQFGRAAHSKKFHLAGKTFNA